MTPPSSELGPVSGENVRWAYDNAGNILSKTTYAYTTGELGSASSVTEYTYGEDAWGDLLTEYDGEAITYDAIGNPTRDHYANTYTWKQGRQLASYKEDGNEAEDVFHFIYNADGLRVKAYNAYTTYRYIYSGTKLVQMEISDTSTGAVSHTLSFTYDAQGTPQTLTYDGTVYYYAANLQGDVTAILDSTGAAVVTYSYDAWGRHTTGSNGTGTLASTLGKHNPLRYRGYVFDTESGLYYLQSRYYNPEIGRFINADAYASTGQGMLGNNAFSYCLNNPVFYEDVSGCFPQKVTDKQIHDMVLAYICSKQANLSFIGTCIYYNGKDSKGGWGFCDLYNTQTGEVWELKKASDSYSCRTSTALRQLTKYTNGRLKHNMDLELCLPYTTTINSGSFSFAQNGYIYDVSFWSEENGIIRYSYDKREIDDDKFIKVLLPVLIVATVTVVAPYLIAGCGGAGAGAVMVAIA